MCRVGIGRLLETAVFKSLSDKVTWARTADGGSAGHTESRRRERKKLDRRSRERNPVMSACRFRSGWREWTLLQGQLEAGNGSGLHGRLCYLRGGPWCLPCSCDKIFDQSNAEKKDCEGVTAAEGEAAGYAVPAILKQREMSAALSFLLGPEPTFTVGFPTSVNLVISYGHSPDLFPWWLNPIKMAG